MFDDTDTFLEEFTVPKTWADINNLIGPIEWSWEKWLPKGFLTLLTADSGEGKSGVGVRLCGSFINSMPLLDNSPYTGQPGCVVV